MYKDAPNIKNLDQVIRLMQRDMSAHKNRFRRSRYPAVDLTSQENTGVIIYLQNLEHEIQTRKKFLTSIKNVEEINQLTEQQLKKESIYFSIFNFYKKVKPYLKFQRKDSRDFWEKTYSILQKYTQIQDIDFYQKIGELIKRLRKGHISTYCWEIKSGINKEFQGILQPLYYDYRMIQDCNTIFQKLMKGKVVSYDLDFRVERFQKNIKCFQNQIRSKCQELREFLNYRRHEETTLQLLFQLIDEIKRMSGHKEMNKFIRSRSQENSFDKQQTSNRKYYNSRPPTTRPTQSRVSFIEQKRECPDCKILKQQLQEKQRQHLKTTRSLQSQNQYLKRQNNAFEKQKQKKKKTVRFETVEDYEETKLGRQMEIKLSQIVEIKNKFNKRIDELEKQLKQRSLELQKQKEKHLKKDKQIQQLQNLVKQTKKVNKNFEDEKKLKYGEIQAKLKQKQKRVEFLEKEMKSKSNLLQNQKTKSCKQLEDIKGKSQQLRDKQSKLSKQNTNIQRLNERIQRLERDNKEFISSAAQKRQEHVRVVKETQNLKKLCKEITAHLFEGAVLNDFDQKYKLIKEIQATNKKKILRTNKLYHYPRQKGYNFHSFIDGKPHYVVAVKLQNNMTLVGYSKESLKKQYGTNPGFIGSLTNDQFFYKENMKPQNKFTTYHADSLIFGNIELGIKGNKVESNLGSEIRFFDNKGQSSAIFFGKQQKQAKILCYEIFQVQFV